MNNDVNKSQSAGLTAKDYTISKYLIDTNSISIPNYQRDYSWEKNNIEALINDIYINGEYYYLGNIISTSKLVNPIDVEIVDGQQRIISIFLILFVLKNSYQIIIDKFVKRDNELKLSIKKRIDCRGTDLIKVLYLGEHLKYPNLKKYNEVAIYNHIVKYLKKMEVESNININEFYEKLKKAKIVRINFSSKKTAAHQMFANLNTKGQPLNGLDVIKSQIFQFLPEDYYKENWYKMLDSLEGLNSEEYLKMFYKLKYKKMDYSSFEMYNKIMDKPSASLIYDKIANSEKPDSLYKVYSCVYKYDLTSLKDYLNFSSQVSFDELKNLWNLFGLVKFKQFNIVMVALLLISDEKDRNKIMNNYEFLLDFIKFIFMHQLIMSKKNFRPSTYSSSFLNLSSELYASKNNIKLKIKNTLELDVFGKNFSKEDIIAEIKSFVCKTDNPKFQNELRLARLVIQILYNDFNSDLRAEHFINQSTNKEEAFKIGNIIPVTFDSFGEMSPGNKIKKYGYALPTSNMMKDFIMTYNRKKDKNIKDFVNYRTNYIANKFAEEYERLKNKLKQG